MKICSVLIMFACCFAQAQSQRPAQPDSATANLPAQKIGANDLISITVYDSPELTRSIRVGGDGRIHLPMLKRGISAVGRMPAELEQDIAEALTAEQLIVDPVVTVTVAEYSSRPISVAGAVKTPLTFQAAGPVTLLEAITRAGGLSPDAGSEILVSRKAEPGSAAPLTQRVAVKSLIDLADRDANLHLSGGEEVRVPEVGKVFVVGNVKKAGAYPLRVDSETTVMKALALAEGLTPNAGNQAYVFRKEAGAGAGSKNEIPVELRKIMDRKAPDTALIAGDVLYVPDNRSRRVGMAVLERLINFGAAAGGTALILH